MIFKLYNRVATKAEKVKKKQLNSLKPEKMRVFEKNSGFF